MSSCFSIQEIPLGSVGLILLCTWMTRTMHLMMDDLMSSDFLTCHTFDVILGYVPLSVEICRSPLIRMIIPSYEIRAKLMIRFHFVLTLRGNLSWVIQLGSYFLILLWFLDGVISGAWIPTSPFQWSTCQISYTSPLSYSRVIKTDRIHLMPYWGIFPSFNCRDDGFLIDLLQSSSLSQEIYYLPYWLLFVWFSSRWDFSRAWHSGFDGLAIHDSSVDSCVEIVVVTLASYSLETP